MRPLYLRKYIFVLYIYIYIYIFRGREKYLASMLNELILSWDLGKPYNDFYVKQELGMCRVKNSISQVAIFRKNNFHLLPQSSFSKIITMSVTLESISDPFNKIQ